MPKAAAEKKSGKKAAPKKEKVGAGRGDCMGGELHAHGAWPAPPRPSHRHPATHGQQLVATSHPRTPGHDPGPPAHRLLHRPPPRPQKEKDPNAPKRALSAYMFFCADNREKVKAENPDKKMTELSTVLGAMWKEMSDADKKKARRGPGGVGRAGGGAAARGVGRAGGRAQAAGRSCRCAAPCRAPHAPAVAAAACAAAVCAAVPCAGRGRGEHASGAAVVAPFCARATVAVQPR